MYMATVLGLRPGVNGYPPLGSGRFNNKYFESIHHMMYRLLIFKFIGGNDI
jgi:hypothetical protein